MVCIDILYAQKVAQAQRPPESLIVELPGVGYHWETLQKKRSLSELSDNTHLNESPPKGSEICRANDPSAQVKSHHHDVSREVPPQS